MKIGTKEEMGVANGWRVSVLGSRAQSARNCLRSAHSEELCKHCKLSSKSEALQSSLLCALRAQFRALCERDPKTDDSILSATPISYFMPIFIALLHF